MSSYPGAERRVVLFLVDVEPDLRHTAPDPAGWKSSEAALDQLERLRESLAAATGQPVQLNWFLRCDPQIERTWGRADEVARACPEIIRAIQRHGDWVGIHVHLWRWDSSSSRWWNDFRDPAWVGECLDTSIAGFKEIFGASPESIRFGDRWISNDAVGQLRSRGIRFDLTVEPGLPAVRIHDDPRANSMLPDFRAAPRVPWPPHPENFLEADPNGADSALWMIPLSTTPPAFRLVRRFPYFMPASRSPNLALDSWHIWSHLKAELDRPSRVPLVVVFRSGDFAVPGFRRNFLRTTGQLVRHPGLVYCDFSNPAEAVSRWKLSGGAKPR